MVVFYSFHYERDVHRVQLIRNMGTVEGQKLLNAQEWEAVRAKGDEAIRNWIDEQMKWKSAVVVLIGAQTAFRPWVKYEIQRAWDLRKPLLGIRIHGLSSMGSTDAQGADPFCSINGFKDTIRGFLSLIPHSMIFGERLTLRLHMMSCRRT